MKNVDLQNTFLSKQQTMTFLVQLRTYQQLVIVNFEPYVNYLSTMYK